MAYYGAPGFAAPYGAPQAFRPATTTTTTTWYSGFYNMVQPHELAQLQAWFMSVDMDRSGRITWNELANLRFFGTPLGPVGAQKMIQVFDKDRSGSIDFMEYVTMHGFINKMSQAFFAADRDRSGFLDPAEILTALAVGGFNLPLQVVQVLVFKFGRARPAHVSFAEWVLLCAHVAYIRSVFQWNDPLMTGRMTASFEQLVHITTDALF